MKNILLIILVIATTQVNAQYEKGNWFLGASSSNINFSSSTNSENTIDVTFTGFRDTLVNDTDSLNLDFLFPYSYKLDQDKQSEFNVNLKMGYFIANKLMLGVGLGYETETSLFKTNPDSEITNSSLADSMINVWFTGLPNVNMNGTTYATHYFELYSLVAASVDNDLTYSKTLMTISPFVRYNFQLRKGNSIFVDGSYRMASGKEEVKDAISSISQTTELTSSRINLGIGFSAFLSNKFSVEPQFNYFMYNSTATIKEDVMHPILSVADMGEKTTERTIAGSGINFSVGLSFYF
tara:strand:+ start:1278 stop:2162 length:885 start_codon:yes stop_codon:yes gene_type:complete